MKKKVLLIASLIGVMLLTGCGASFDISSTDLENYSKENNGIYTDISTDYVKNYDYIDGVYILEKDDVHVELWDLDNQSDASKWFKNNIEILEDEAQSSSGSNTTSDGNYTITTGDTVYRILFSKDKGIYAYGNTKDAVNNVLADLNIE